MTVTHLERVGYRAVLSLDCRDAIRPTPAAPGGQVLGAAVNDLAAWAWPETEPGVRRPARRSVTSQLLGFGVLPDHPLEQYARAADAGPLVWRSSTTRNHRVLVVDPRRRYLPVLTTATLPLATPLVVELHTAPTHLPRGGWAVVRGQVLRTSTTDPLPWAVLTVTLAGTPYIARCDAAGVFLLNAPYPEALPPLFGSPPAGPGLGAMTWPVVIEVASAPATLSFPDPQHLDVPDLASVLAQPRAAIDTSGGPQSTTTATLTFGEALALSLSAEPT